LSSAIFLLATRQDFGNLRLFITAPRAQRENKMYLNKVILVGDISDDPKLSKYADSENIFFNLRLERKWLKDGEEQTSTMFVRCIAEGPSGKRLAADTTFGKGANVTIDGSIGVKKNQDGKWDMVVRATWVTINTPGSRAQGETQPAEGFPF